MLSIPTSVLNFVGLVLSWFSWIQCHRVIVASWVFRGFKIFLVGISWVQHFFSWVFHGFKIFLVGISLVQNLFSLVFHGSKIFFVGILWVQNFFLWVFSGFKNFFSLVPKFFSWVFCGSEIFSRGYFVGHKFFLVGISCVENFFSWVFRWFKIFSCGYFVIFSCLSQEKQWYRNISETACSIPNRFPYFVNFIYIRKVFHLLNYLCYYAALICTYIFSHVSEKWLYIKISIKHHGRGLCTAIMLVIKCTLNFLLTSVFPVYSRIKDIFTTTRNFLR